MRRDARNTEVVNRRCEKLISLGFEILHEDSRVEISLLSGEKISVDFSAIGEDHFISYAMNQVFGYAYDLGKSEKLKEIKEALEL